MSLYYLDSSALVKRYVTETGTRWIQGLTDPASGNTVIIATLTRIEAAAALAARHRAPGGITRAERDGAVALLDRHCNREYILIPNDSAILDRALILTQNHRLRGYDAVQLATALIVNDRYLAAGLSALTFVAADDDLLAAAQTEGLASDNPNAHP